MKEVRKTLALRPGHTRAWVHEFVVGYGSVCITDAGKKAKLPTCDYILSFHGAFRMYADIYHAEVERLAAKGIHSPTWCKGVAIGKTLVIQKLGARNAV